MIVKVRKSAYETPFFVGYPMDKKLIMTSDLHRS